MADESCRNFNIAAIGVGANIEPEKNIAAAREILASEQRLLTASSFVYTAPIGYTDQPDFLNGAFLVATRLDHEQFTTYLKTVENRLGRVRNANKFGPRTIDLDIVIWNGTIIDRDYRSRSFLRNAIRRIWPDPERRPEVSTSAKKET